MDKGFKHKLIFAELGLYAYAMSHGLVAYILFGIKGVIFSYLIIFLAVIMYFYIFKKYKRK